MTEMGKIAQRVLELIDLTLLNENATVDEVALVCKQAKSPVGNTAAVCIYPRFIPLARQKLNEQGTPDIYIATVTNFPHGNENICLAREETQAAVDSGADEIDIVFPYRALMEGHTQLAFKLVEACKKVCAQGNVLLKVILETGELKAEALISQASEIAIDAGADFIKTSTGKVSVNATSKAAEIMLGAILRKNVKETVGFKAAGGIRTVEEAAIYLKLADDILGHNWADKRHFRFGASSLLVNLLKTMGYQSGLQDTNY